MIDLNTSGKFRMIVDYLTEMVPYVECVIVTNKNGHIIESMVSKEYRLSWISSFASIISKRFSIDKFNTQLEGLDITVNFFKTKAVLVKMFEKDHMLIVITSRNITSITNAMEGMEDSMLVNL